MDIESIKKLIPSKDIQLDIIYTISKLYTDIKFEFTASESAWNAEFGSTLEIILNPYYEEFNILQLENKKLYVEVETNEFDILDFNRLNHKIYTVFNSLFKCINTYCKDNNINKVYISTFYDTYLNILEKNNQTYIIGTIHIFV